VWCSVFLFFVLCGEVCLCFVWCSVFVFCVVKCVCVLCGEVCLCFVWCGVFVFCAGFVIGTCAVKPLC